MAAEEGLITHYIDRTGIQADTDFLLKQLNEALAALNKLQAVKINIGGAQSTTAATEGVKEYKKQLDELQKIEQQIIKTYEKRQAAGSQVAKDLATERDALAQRNREGKLRAVIANEEEGSLRRMRAELSLLTMQYDKLSGAEKKAAAGKELEKKVLAQVEAIKKEEQATGRYFRNVGNYSGAVTVLENALQDVGKKLDDMNKAGNANAEVVAALEREYELLNNIVSSQSTGFVSMREEIKKNQTAIEQLTLVYGEDSEVVKKLIAENGQLRDSMADIVATQKTLGSDTFAFDALLQGGQALVGMYSAAEGAIALFGDENEELQKTMVKLQAAMALVQGVQATVNALQAEGALIQGLQTARTVASAAAMKVYTFVMSGATAAARTFNSTLLLGGALTGVLLLLPLITSAMSAFGDETDDTTQSLEDLNDELDYSNQLLEDNIQSFEFNNKVQLEKMKQRGATESQLNQQTVKDLEQLAIKYKAAADERQKLFDQQASSKELNDGEKLKNIADEVMSLRKKQREAERAAQIKQDEEETRIAEDGRKKRQESSNAAAEKERARQERELKAQFDLLKFYKEQEISYLEANAQNENINATQRTNFRSEQLEKQEALTLAQRDFELKNAELTASEKKLIEEKAAADILALRTQYIADVAAIQVAQRDKEAADAERDSAAIQSSIDKTNQDKLTAIQTGFDNETAAIARASNKRLKALDESYLQGEISKEEHEEKKAQAEAEALQKSLQAQIQYYKALVNLYATDEKAKQAALDKIAELEKQLTGIAVEETGKRSEASKESAAKMKDALNQLSNELQGLGFDLLAGSIEKEKNAIQEQVDALETKKQKEIEVANQTITNEQEKAAAIQVIEARANAQKEQLQQRQRALDERRARYERARNIADIIQSTAIAVVSALGSKPWGPQNIALAAVVGAIGAAQIARTLATPIPKYKEGTANHPGGLAVVGDGGTEEFVITPDGSVMKTPATDTLVDLPKGSVVVPDEKKFMELQMMMAHKQMGRINDSYNKAGEDKQLKAIAGKLDQLNTTIKNKREIEIKGVSKRDILMKHGSNYARYLND